MLDIKEIKAKYNDIDVTVLKQQFKQLLGEQWNNMQHYFKTQDVDESLKYRTLYLYDKIRGYIEDKSENINKSFFVLYNRRLRKVDNLHSNEYQKCLDILNLFSDIKHYLEKVDDVNLKSYYHLEKGVKMFSMIDNLNKEGILC